MIPTKILNRLRESNLDPRRASIPELLRVRGIGPQAILLIAIHFKENPEPLPYEPKTKKTRIK